MSRKKTIGMPLFLSSIVILAGFFVYFSFFLGTNLPNVNNNNENDDNDDNPDNNPLPILIEGDLWIAAYHPIYEWPNIAGNVPWGEINELIVGYLFLEEISEGNYGLKHPVSGQSLTSFFEDASEFIEEGHEHDVKVTCMIGGEDSNPGSIWNEATSSDNLDQFSQNMVNSLQGAGFDGFSLDWEEGIDYPQYVNLAAKLRDLWPQSIISIATIPFRTNPVTIEKQLAPAKDDVDYFIVMSYSPISQWGGWEIPIPLTPLYNDYNEYSVSHILQRWNESGVPSSKVMMGVGGFGAVWGDSNGDGLGPIAPYSTEADGTAEGEWGPMLSDYWTTWKWVNNTLETHPEFIEEWDDMGKCSYWHAPAPDELIETTVYVSAKANISLIFYETPRSMVEKSNFCVNNSMLGMGFWTLSQMMKGTSCPILEAI